MTAPDLDAIEARANANTAPPWREESAADVRALVAHIRALHAAARELLAADDALAEAAAQREGETYTAWRERQERAPARVADATAALAALVPEVPR